MQTLFADSLLAGTLLAVVASFFIAAATPGSSLAEDEMLEITVLGDSLVAGYGLAPSQAFPVRLEEKLREQGFDVDIANAGVSGDTTAGGLSRLEWSVPADSDGVILELGANDALRGIEPAATRENLDAMIRLLTERGLPVLLAGMMAPPNLGEEYAAVFNSIYSDLAQLHGVDLYPFFLDGVAADPGLNQSDGIHPNAQGVEVVVSRMLPFVKAFIERIREEKRAD